MRFKVKLHSDSNTINVDLDLSKMNLTAEQRPIVEKLLRQVENEPIDLNEKNACEQGKCLASKYLSPDEFAKVRDIRITLGSKVAHPNLVCDFCLNCVA